MSAPRFTGNMKRCTGCTRVWPLSPLYWHRRKGRPLGYSSRCRECCNAQVLAWREAHPDYHCEWVKRNPERVAASLRRRADRLLEQAQLTTKPSSRE